jgi:hypothetical protein
MERLIFIQPKCQEAAAPRYACLCQFRPHSIIAQQEAQIKSLNTLT